VHSVNPDIKLVLTRDWVKLSDCVHVGQRKNEFILDRNAATDKASVSALGHDGDSTVVAPLEDFADLLGRFWFQDRG
jgi:hypothetical protein